MHAQLMNPRQGETSTAFDPDDEGPTQALVDHLLLNTLRQRCEGLESTDQDDPLIEALVQAHLDRVHAKTPLGFTGARARRAQRAPAQVRSGRPRGVLR